MAPMAPDPEETIMLRKLSLVAVAAASLGVAALAPTSASAWYGHGGWHHGGWHHGGGGWGGARLYAGGPGEWLGFGGARWPRGGVPGPCSVDQGEPATFQSIFYAKQFPSR